MGEADHEVASLNTLLVIFLLGLSLFLAYIMKKHHFYYVPESAAAMMCGMLIGGVARLWLKDETERKKLVFQPELFFFVLLPPIIFEAGLSLKRKSFFSNFVTIVFYAVLGTIISTFIIGMAVYGMAKSGLVDVDTKSPLQALLFGALISAVDPVATLSIMGSAELNCDQLLYSLVFGESVLNDAVAIVLFKTFASLTGTDSLDLNKWTSYLVLIGTFLGISIGSIIVGVLIGLAASFMFKNTGIRKYPHKEIVALFLFAYSAYALAEAILLSGIMSLFFCGIVLAHYNWTNLSDATKVASHHVFKGFAMTTETIVFAYMGMSLLAGNYASWNPTFIALSIGTCLVARVFNIFPLSLLTNIRRKKKIPMRMQFVMWFAGLRGAIAFALSINMPEVEGWNNDVIITTTLCIVIFTTVVCGGLTEPMLSRMGMKNGGADSESEAEDVEQVLHPRESPRSLNVRLTSAGVLRGAGGRYSGIHLWWKRIDLKYMRPWFGGVDQRTTALMSPTAGVELREHQSGDVYTRVSDDEGDSPPGKRGARKLLSSPLNGSEFVTEEWADMKAQAGNGDVYRPPGADRDDDVGDLGGGSGDFFGGSGAGAGGGGGVGGGGVAVSLEDGGL